MSEKSNGVERAPRPSRASYARSLYDAVEAIGGRAHLSEVIDILPATEDASRWNKATPEYVQTMLYTQVASGYLCTGEDKSGQEFWQIAPRDYFEKRRALRDTNGRIRGKQKSYNKRAEIVIDHRATRRAGLVGFVAGIITTLAAIGLAT